MTKFSGQLYKVIHKDTSLYIQLKEGDPIFKISNQFHNTVRLKCEQDNY